MDMAIKEEETAGDTGRLVLPSLEIKNFRAFRHLTVEKLGRVNLITGRNNVGKTSLLEALWLYAQQGSPWIIRELLRSRNELSAPLPSRPQTVATESQSFNVRYLFNGRGFPLLDKSSPIIIGEMAGPNNLFISIGLADDGEARDTFGGTQKDTNNIRPKVFREIIPYVSVRYGDSAPFSYRLDKITTGLSQVEVELEIDVVPCKMVWPNGFGVAIGRMWDSITFTDAERDVLDALRLVAKEVERINLIGDAESARNRVPVVKLTGVDGPVPLKSLGDGLSRLFGMTMALVTSRDGILLIDEIDTGLHYSVLLDVWRLIFQTARRLNVQVFATTHSWDCIEAFQKAAAEDDDPASGVLVRLQNTNGDVTSTVFDERRLAIVTRDGIEVR